MSQKFNDEFNNRLHSTNKVNQIDINALVEAYRYDSATSTNWLVNKLRILKEIIESGNSIEIEGVGIINEHDELKQWIINKFSLAISKNVY